MKKNVGFIVGIILLMAFVWALTMLVKSISTKQEKSSTSFPTLAITLIL